MPVGEILIGAFIEVLLEKLASSSSDLINFASSQGIHSQLQKWTNTLIQIKALLVDAGQKHITDRAVQIWLKDLHVLAYDIDDLLDDLATEALHLRLTPESQASTRASKLRKHFPTFFNRFSPSTIMYGRQLSSKLDEITTRMNAIVEMKNTLGLNVHNGSSSIADRRPKETSLVDESSVVGREGDKEALLKKLLGDEPCYQNVTIVPIVGMGGIGKTTLARILYNDEAVKKHFELKVWVCVSDEFDIFMISKIIFQAVTGKNPEFADLNLLQVALQDKLSNKKFLLVLDDVWNEKWENWERLQRPFQAGAPGSKIIVTTRSSKVVSTMGRIKVYPLDVLSSEDSLFLLAHHALGERNFDAHSTIKSYGEGIVKKCQCLPLALMALGRVLSTKTDEEDWEELLNNEIWNLDENEGNILPALRLSYHHLPPHLKQLFAYCSFFPKDYVFDKEELVLLWMAEGFLQTNGRKSMESLGYEYLKELTSRSFFQNSTNKDSEYLMHDLMNDLATSVAGEFFLRLDEKMNVDESNEALDKLHHFSFVRQEYGVYKKFKALERAKRLRTFLSRPNFHNGYLSNKVVVDLLPQLEFLRVLSLNNSLVSKVPESIGRMKHLRYLDVSRTEIKCLPDQVSSLYNLQTLSVRGCRYLTSLPNSFAKLINLRHFDSYDTSSLEKMPLGIGGLTSLQTLSKVIISGTNGFKITELKGLSDLRGRLCIKGLHEVRNANHAKEANLQQKEGLYDLEMEWSDVFDDSQNESIEDKIIEGLKPHAKLKILKIVCYGGRKFPSWLEDPYLSQLTHLTLRGCRRCIDLPSKIGQLPRLQTLVVESMDGVNFVGPELSGRPISAKGVAFPLLEYLEFRDMKGWEMWSTNGGNDNKNVELFPRLRKLVMTGCPKLVEVSIGFFPCLSELVMTGCPKLVEVSIGLFPCLRALVMKGCPKLVKVSIGSISSLQVLEIEGCCVEVLRSLVGAASSAISRLEMSNIEGLTRLHGGVLEHLGGVEELTIEGCDEVKYLWESEAEASKILVKLRQLRLLYCEELVCLGKKEDLNFERKDSLFTSLRQVKIVRCKRLERYNCPDSVEKLEMMSCYSVTSFPFKKGQKFPSSALKSLVISGCEEMEAVGEENWLLLKNSSSSLESLYIHSWSNLRYFPTGCFIHLSSLSIKECEGIESFPEMCFHELKYLRTLEIEDCKNLKWFPDEELQSLTSLVTMTIRDCGSMDESFPRGLWPPNLTRLEIGRLKKLMSEWGQQNFPTSLVELRLYGENLESGGGVVSFGDGGNTTTTPSSPLLLPSSLTSLSIWYFENLESISKGLQHLTSLDALDIRRCRKLRDLPETLLPSLSKLIIIRCPKLKGKCSSNGRWWEYNYWHLISHIPHHRVRDN